MYERGKKQSACWNEGGGDISARWWYQLVLAFEEGYPIGSLQVGDHLCLEKHLVNIRAV